MSTVQAVRAALVAAVVALVAWAAPAAAFDFSGCGKFEILTPGNVVFELSPNTLITGDVMAFGPTSYVSVGNKNDIKGSVFAHEIRLGSGSVVAVCVDDIRSGAGQCLLETQPFVAPPGCTFTGGFPPGINPETVPSVCLPGTAVTITGAQTLAPGCYSRLTVDKLATLTLQAGQRYAFKGEVRIKNGATVLSDIPKSHATIVTAGIIITEPGVTLTDLFLFQLGKTNPFHIFNNNILTRVLAFAQSRAIHIHTGSQMIDSALTSAVATGVGIEVQPIVSKHSDDVPVVCECPPGFRFAVEVCADGVSCAEARRCIEN